MIQALFLLVHSLVGFVLDLCLHLLLILPRMMRLQFLNLVPDSVRLAPVLWLLFWLPGCSPPRKFCLFPLVLRPQPHQLRNQTVVALEILLMMMMLMLMMVVRMFVGVLLVLLVLVVVLVVLALRSVFVAVLVLIVAHLLGGLQMCVPGAVLVEPLVFVQCFLLQLFLLLR